MLVTRFVHSDDCSVGKQWDTHRHGSSVPACEVVWQARKSVWASRSPLLSIFGSCTFPVLAANPSLLLVRCGCGYRRGYWLAPCCC